MPTKGDEDRLKLFRRYSANLALYVSGCDGRFACPICLKGFVEDDVLHDNLLVDVGHVYPKELNGRLVTLECRACNGRLNQAGDAELIRHHKDWDAVRSDGSGRNAMRADLMMPSGRVRVSVTHAGVTGHFAHSSPAAFAEAVEALANKVPFRIDRPPPDKGRLNLAHLHSAHLALFRHFGYAYLFSHGGRWAQRWLAPAAPLEPAPYLSTEVFAGSPIGSAHHLRCGIVTFGDGESCLGVVLPSADPRAVCELVLLPGPDESDVAAYDRIVATQANKGFRGTCRLVRERPWQRLVAPEYIDRLPHLWAGMDDDALDRAKLMHAIREVVGGTTARKADAGTIAKRWGWSSNLTRRLLAELVGDGYLSRAPKIRRPQLVRLTDKALSRF